MVAAQILYTGHRRDLPSFTNQDPSGSFGGGNAAALRIVALGDSSITAPGVEPLDDCWIRRVAIELAAERRVELTSVGRGGAKSRDVLTSQVGQANALGADLALLSVGANDVLRLTPLRRFEAEMIEICARLVPNVGTVVILGVGDLGTIPRLPRDVAWWVSRRARRANSIARSMEDRFDTVASCDPWTTMTGFRTRDPRLWVGDRFHASAAGHEIFYKGALPVVRKALASVESPP